MRYCPFCAEEVQDAAVVCKHCRRDLPDSRRGERGSAGRQSTLIRVLAFVGALAVLGYGTAVWTGVDTGGLAGNFLPAMEFTVGQKALEISPGSWNMWSWEIDPKRPVCRVSATIRGISGGSRDFEAFLMDEDGYTNWNNRTNPRVFYRSGRVSSATVDGVIHGAGPKYYIVVSNRFSTFTGKTVELQGGRVVCTAS
jgi:hypothetical protein